MLTVTSGGHTLASLDFIGHHVTSNFISSADASGHLEITDPHAATTLASTANSSSSPNAGANSVPLLGMYMAALFASPEG